MSETRKGNRSSHNMSFKGERVDERRKKNCPEGRGVSAPCPGPGQEQCERGMSH